MYIINILYRPFHPSSRRHTMNFFIKMRLHFILIAYVMWLAMTEYMRVESIRGGADSLATAMAVVFTVLAFYIHEANGFTKPVKEFLAIFTLPVLFMALNNLRLGYSSVNWMNACAMGFILWLCLRKA